jgi:predicted ribosome quality control (RQC) complex YloA/Tae2 family protein
MKEEFSNIFEHAAQQSPKKKKPIPSVPLKLPFSQEEKKAAPDPLSDEKVQELLKKIHDIHKEIETKLESVYERNDLSPQKLDTYLEMFSESGYTLAQLKEVHKEQKKLEERIANAFGGSGKTLAQTHKEHEQVKAAKERHGKSLGARKQWIPMK